MEIDFYYSFSDRTFLISVEKLLFREGQHTPGHRLWMPGSVLLLTRLPWRHLKTWGQAAVLSNWTFVLKPFCLPNAGWCDGSAEAGSKPMFSMGLMDTWTTALRCFKSVCWKKRVSLPCVCLPALIEIAESSKVGVVFPARSPFFFFSDASQQRYFSL